MDERDNMGSLKWLTLVTVALNGFIIVLDISIVNISFPMLTRIFETEPSVVLWVSIVYSLICVGLMPILGNIGDLYGKKKVFVLGSVLFTLGLVFCSLSNSIYQLIISRIIQAVGGAMNMALGFALVTDAFPANERGKALGIMASVFSIGPIVGVTLGGFLLDAIGWRSIFYMRAPICIIGIIMAWRLLRENRPSDLDRTLDIPGAVALFGSLTSMLLFLNLGGRKGFLSLLIIALGAAAFILFCLFIVREMRTGQPVVDLNLFRDSIFSFGCISGAIWSFVYSIQLFIFPYYLIDGIDYTATGTGLILAVPSLFMFAVSPLSGWLSDKLGTRILSILGMCMLSLGLFMLSRLGIEASLFNILSGLIILGIGTGLFQTPNTSLLMGSVPKTHLGTVGALIITIRQVGMASGFAVAGMVFTIRRAVHTSLPGVEDLDPSFLESLSLIGGYRDTILIAALICCIGIVTSYISGRGKDQKP